MIVAGIDCGARNTKVVLLRGGEVVSQIINVAHLGSGREIREAYEAALAKTDIEDSEVQKVVATGVGRREVDFAHDTITEVSADALGIHHLLPDVRTILDVGAEEARAIRINAAGKVLDFAVNEKCAAGTGAFVEAMARALEVDYEDIGKLSLASTQLIPINAQCVVFAESEVVSLMHRQVAKADVARAIHHAISERIASMAEKVGIEDKLVLIGGLAKNIGLIESLKNQLATDVLVAENPEFVGAVGAAYVALSR